MYCSPTIVKSVSEQENCYYMFTYDKINNFVTVSRYDLYTNDIEASITTELTDVFLSVQGISRSSTQSVITESLYGYEIEFGSTTYWTLYYPLFDTSTHPAQTTVRERDANRSYLESYRTTINQIASLESEISATVGVATFLAAVSSGYLVATGPAGFAIAVTGYLAALGFDLTAIQQNNDLEELLLDAEYYKEKIKYAPLD